MRNKFIPALVLLLIINLFARSTAQDKPDSKPDQEKPKKIKRPEIEDAVKRAYHKATHIEDVKMGRFEILTNADDGGDDGVLAIVEFASGEVGLYQGSRDNQKDQWILIEKVNLNLVEDAAGRGRRK
jgi:hypothetical protein